MKLALALTAAAAISIGAAATDRPAYSAETPKATVLHSDISAARYHERRNGYRTSRRAPHHARYVAPSFNFIGPPGYPGEYAWRKSIGECVIDLGYGRFESCNK